MNGNNHDEPTREQIESAIDEIKIYYGNQPELMEAVIDKLYKEVSNKQGPRFGPQPSEIPTPSSQHEKVQDQGQLYRNGNSPLPTEQQMLTIRNDTIFTIHKNQLQFVLAYEQKLAALLFLKHGYGITFFREEVNRQGGLFEATESRYKHMVSGIVMKAFERIADVLNRNRFKTVKVHQMEESALCGILFECRKWYSDEEVGVFMKFIQMAYNQCIPSFKVNKGTLITFYQTTRHLITQKMQKSRSTFTSLPKTLNAPPMIPAPGKRSMKFTKGPILGKSQKQTLEDSIVKLYIQYQKISETQSRFNQIHGKSSQFTLHSEIQGVIFKWCKKAIKDIQKYCQNYYMSLPLVEELSQAKIQQILISTRGLQLRVKLLLLAIHFKMPHHQFRNNLGNMQTGNSWQLDPNKLFQTQKALLMDLIKELNIFNEEKEEEELQLFDGMPPRYRKRGKGGKEMEGEDRVERPIVPMMRHSRRERAGNNLYNHRNVLINKKEKLSIRKLGFF